MSNKILFFGNERLASAVTTTAPTLQALIVAGYDITGVVVAQQAIGASRKSRDLEIVQVAEQHNIRVFSPANLREITAELAASEAQIGVLVAYGKIVPGSIIDLFPRGIVNIHPSLLPKHRGPTPIESVILAGEQQTGVSLMSLATAMDSGPLYAQQAVALRGDETKAELANHLLGLGKDMLLDALPGILAGSLQPVAQNDLLATYDNLLAKELSPMDWQKPATQLAREVRAYAGWPRSRATLHNVEVIITAAHSSPDHGQPGTLRRAPGELAVYTSDGTLIIDALIPAGKREMSGAAFLAGRPDS